jgi:hypothetical protein
MDQRKKSTEANEKRDDFPGMKRFGLTIRHTTIQPSFVILRGPYTEQWTFRSTGQPLTFSEERRVTPLYPYTFTGGPRLSYDRMIKHTKIIC